jgi:hypothetical protein
MKDDDRDGYFDDVHVYDQYRNPQWVNGLGLGSSRKFTEKPSRNRDRYMWHESNPTKELRKQNPFKSQGGGNAYANFSTTISQALGLIGRNSGAGKPSFQERTQMQKHYYWNVFLPQLLHDTPFAQNPRGASQADPVTKKAFSETVKARTAQITPQQNAAMAQLIAQDMRTRFGG